MKTPSRLAFEKWYGPEPEDGDAAELNWSERREQAWAFWKAGARFAAIKPVAKEWSRMHKASRNRKPTKHILT